MKITKLAALAGITVTLALGLGACGSTSSGSPAQPSVVLLPGMPQNMAQACRDWNGVFAGTYGGSNPTTQTLIQIADRPGISSDPTGSAGWNLSEDMNGYAEGLQAATGGPTGIGQGGGNDAIAVACSGLGVNMANFAG